MFKNEKEVKKERKRKLSKIEPELTKSKSKVMRLSFIIILETKE